MTRLQVIVYEYSRGISLDLSTRMVSARLSHGKHGNLRFDVSAVMDKDEAYAFYTLAGTPTVELNAGPIVIWRGRAEKIGVRDNLLTIGALGKWRALSDLQQYTCLWSDASYDQWQQISDDLISTSANDQYQLDKKSRLMLEPRHNDSITGSDGGYWGYIVPENSRKNLVVVQFAYDLTGATFTGKLQSRNSSWASPSSLWSLSGSVGSQTGAKFITFSAAAALTFEHIANSTTSVTNTGSKYLKITHLRVATSSANIVDTTYGSNITAGAQTITPANMTGIYVGQELVITGSGSVGEIVEVTAITSTTFDATFALSHTATVAIKGIVVYGDEVVKDVLSAVNTLNSDQLSSVTALIESPGIDMVDAVYLDRDGASVVEDIADRGGADGAAWETGVNNDGVLYLRPLGDDSLSWAVDARISLERDLAQLANEVISVHKATDETLKRTDAATDLASQQTYGIKRQAAVDVHTTRPVEAEAVRDVVLERRKIPAPRVDLDFNLIFSSAGSLGEPFLPHAGDVLVARNVPPTNESPPDNVASFRISRWEYDVLANQPKAEVEGISIVNQLAGIEEKPVVNGQRKPFLIAATDRIKK